MTLTLLERVVRVKRGQRVLIDAGRGAQISVERDSSGAVILRSEQTGHVLRQWSPKEAKTP